MADLAHRPVRTLYASLTLIGLMCALPLIQPRHTNPITSFYSEWLAVVLGAAALYPLILARYARPLGVPLIALAPLALLLLLLGHGILVRSAYPQQPLLAAAYLAWAAGLMTTGVLLRQEVGPDRIVRALAGFILAGGLVNAVAAVLQQYDIRGALEPLIATQIESRAYGNLGQANHFATHIMLALVAALFLFSQRALSLVWVVAIAALLLFVLTLSGSRSTWLYLGMLAAMAVLGFRLNRTDAMRRGQYFALALLPGFALTNAVTALSWLAPPIAHSTVIDRLFGMVGTPSERVAVWGRAWAMFVDHPWWGVGWGEFAWHNFSLTGVPGIAPLTGLYNHAHNLVLHLLAETGIVGAALVTGGIVLWAWHARRELRHPCGFWIWATLAVFALHSMMEYPLWNAYFLGIAAVVAGIGETRILKLQQARLVRLATVVAIGVTVLLSGLMLDRYYRLESVVHRRYEPGNARVQAWAHEDMMAARASFFLAPYVDLAYARAIDLNRQDIERKLAFMERVMHFAPTGLVSYRYAVLHALRGDEAQSDLLLARATASYPELIEAFTRELAATDLGDAAVKARLMSRLQGYPG